MQHTAYEHLDLITLLRRWDVSPDELLANVSRRAGPARRGSVERVHDAERVRVRALERGKLFAEENVRFAHVGIKQREARPVRRVVQRVVEQLVQWRDARAAANERDVFKLIRCVRFPSP